MRITEYDYIRKIYVIKPDAPQGIHIQKLGELEDRDEKKDVVFKRTDGGGGHVLACPKCENVLPSEIIESNFCPFCGQKLSWGWV